MILSELFYITCSMKVSNNNSVKVLICDKNRCVRSLNKLCTNSKHKMSDQIHKSLALLDKIKP